MFDDGINNLEIKKNDEANIKWSPVFENDILVGVEKWYPIYNEGSFIGWKKGEFLTLEEYKLLQQVENSSPYSMLTEEFCNFCNAHCCRETCKDRSDYCPIADEVRKQWGAIHGGGDCQYVFYQQKNKAD